MATLRVNHPRQLIVSCRLTQSYFGLPVAFRLSHSPTGLSAIDIGERRSKKGSGGRPWMLSHLPVPVAAGSAGGGVALEFEGSRSIVGVGPRGLVESPVRASVGMSDPKHGGNVGPNDPAYYAPRELRERGASGEPDSVLRQAAEWRPRLTTEDPPPQAPGRLPQRRENSEMFTKAVAQALQEQMEPALVEAPSVLRDLSRRRALFSVVLRISRWSLRQALHRFSSWPSRRRSALQTTRHRFRRSGSRSNPPCFRRRNSRN